MRRVDPVGITVLLMSVLYIFLDPRVEVKHLNSWCIIRLDGGWLLSNLQCS